MKLLFICSFNSIRSRTAEVIYENYGPHIAKSAGIMTNARIRINAGLIDWADIIFTMDSEQEAYIRTLFPATSSHRGIINLNISGEYYFNQPELINEIREKVDPYLESLLPSGF